MVDGADLVDITDLATGWNLGTKPALQLLRALFSAETVSYHQSRPPARTQMISDDL